MNTIHVREEAVRCLLCADAPCSKACGNGDPARMIRAVRFGNESIARRWVAGCSESELEAAEKEAMNALKTRLNETLSAIAQQRGLALIVNTDSDACPFINPALGEDINEIVKDALK